jgi:hypothetical protein
VARVAADCHQEPHSTGQHSESAGQDVMQTCSQSSPCARCGFQGFVQGLGAETQHHMGLSVNGTSDFCPAVLVAVLRWGDSTAPQQHRYAVALNCRFVFRTIDSTAPLLAAHQLFPTLTLFAPSQSHIS